MRAVKYILILSLTAAALAACRKDPLKDIEKGHWNNDRTVLDIKFKGQAGVAQIDNDEPHKGTIRLTLATDEVADMSKVELETLVTSYNASSNVRSGETMDFSTTEPPTLTVTSPTGQDRIYTIVAGKFNETLKGIYDITGLVVYGGTGAEYGGDGAPTLNADDIDKYWTGNNAKAETDNYLEFTMTEFMANGNTRGTCVHNPGEDEKYFDCIFAGAENPTGTGDIDLARFYRKIPKGESTWERNYRLETITFTDADGKQSVCSLVGSGTYTHGNRQVVVADSALQFALSGEDDWDHLWSHNIYVILAKAPKNYYVMIKKR